MSLRNANRLSVDLLQPVIFQPISNAQRNQQWRHLSSLLVLMLVAIGSSATAWAASSERQKSSAELTATADTTAKSRAVITTTRNGNTVINVPDKTGSMSAIPDFFPSNSARSAFLAELNETETPTEGFAGTLNSILKTNPNSLSTPGATAGFLNPPESTVLQYANNQSSTGLGFKSTIEQNYVLRYVCCSQLPIIINPNLPPDELFADDNVVAVPEQNEVVAVFDDLPVYNGEQLFVRVQRSGGQHYPGWFPLFWLHEVSSQPVQTKVDTGVSYKAIARAIRKMTESVFYNHCASQVHPAGGEPTFGSSGGNADYECGELPAGNKTNTKVFKGNTFKYLTHIPKNLDSITIEQKKNDFHAIGYHDNDDTPEMEFTIPFYLGGINTQSRADWDSPIATLDDPDYEFFTRTYWQYQSQQDDKVRVHPMDWYFKTYYDPNASNPHHAVNFSLRVNLPGIDIYSPWFDKELVFWYDPIIGWYKDIHFSAIRLGGVKIDEIPLQIDGRIVLSATEESQNTDFDQAFTTDPNTRVGVEFTNVEFTRIPYVRFYDGISLQVSEFDDSMVLWALVDIFLESVDKALLKSPSNIGASLFWLAMQDHLNGALLDALNELKPKLTKVFDTPRALAQQACGAVMPAGYKTKLSPYYAFYRQCRDFAATINNEGFVDNGLLPVQQQQAFSQSPDLWANVNVGGLGWGDTSQKKQAWPCVDDSCTTLYIDRPWWTHYEPNYNLLGGSKFSPANYSYSSHLGGKVQYQASGQVLRHYWHFVQCLIPEADRTLNTYLDESPEILTERLQTNCKLPALDTLCKLYGEGEDLEALWEARWGYTPPLSGYAMYCAWADELRNEQKDYGTFEIEVLSQDW